ncbi:MAG: S8 family serine peptidase [bacterium]
MKTLRYNFKFGQLVYRRISALTVLILLGLMTLPAYAFRNDEDKASFPDAVAQQQKKLVTRIPSAGQLKAAETGGKLGVKTTWHSRLNTPSSIRGADLGQHQAFSGGKGVSLKGAGAYQDDSIAVLDNLASFFQIKDAKKEFTVRKVAPDTLGFHHVRVSQTHQGLRVVGGELAVHFNKKGQAYEVNGQYVPDINVSVIPLITAEYATQIAQADLKGLGNPAGTLAKAPELVVFALDAEPRLAYELTLSYRAPGATPGRWRYWIDGLQGKILLRYNDIKRIAPPTSNGSNSAITGSALTGEGGAVTNVPGWYENTGNYYLYSKTLNWCVYNVATNGYPDFNTYAYRTTADWGVSDRSEMSVALGFDQIQRYFSQVHGLNSFDGAGAFARANVHEGVDYVNAYWDGSAFYFGDGDGVSANSLAVLDIAGHEFTHAVTDYSANLIYYSESGALNESFSDIFGSCVEFFSQKDDRVSYPARTPGQADWLCGEDSWLESTALRDMRNPANTATVGAGNEQPTRYQGTYWYYGTGDYGGVHYNSGVQNFFFYLLCEGGSGTNDGIAYSVTGIGITNAEQVAYRALTVYCTDHTDYRTVRGAWLSAAQDLNPAWSVSVSAAWDAVGIQALTVTPAGGASFSGPVGGPFVPTTFVFTIDNSSDSATSWGVSHDQAWMSVSPESGSIPAFGSQTVTVTPNGVAATLPQGNYSGELVFSNLTTSVTLTRSLTLDIFLTPVVQVAPTAITVTNLLGQTRQTTLQIGNAAWADATLDFTLSASEVSRTPIPAPLQPVVVRDFTQLPKGAAYRAGELLVRFNAATTGATVRAQALAAAGGGSIAREFKLVSGLALVKLPEGAAMADALMRLNQTVGILYAQPNYLKKALRTPNDPLFTDLWGMNNTGQIGGVPNADIDAPEAWESGVGGKSVIVAVIDTGVDYQHEDLAANMWINPGEIPGNGIDDDGNGYVDDVYGYDFFNRDADPMDDHGHGTHCSGTIGAVGDNGVGVAGVCWNVKIMALKFLSAAGEGDSAGAISCIEYAVRMGAKVLSNSWGDVPGGAYEQALKDAIDAAGTADVLFVAAAGNDYGNNNDVNPVYPASYESTNIISVMSVSSSGARSSFSNYGLTSVDLAAPGSSILSCKPGGSYQYMSGTSMATPHVAGACALLRSINSGYSSLQIKNALVTTTDSSLPGLCVSGGLMKLANAIALSPAWLRLMPVSGANMAPGVSSNITVTTDVGQMPAGTYEGLIRVSSNDHNTPVTNVPVTMVVLHDDLGIQPTGSFVSSGYTGGPFSPSNMVYTLTNASLTSLSWSASREHPWVSVSPADGTLAAGQVAQVSVSFAAPAGLLSTGEFSDNVVFSNVTHTTAQHRGVSLTVLERQLDHFEWQSIAPTQYVGQAFGVTAQAIDTTGNVLTNFTGTVALKAPTGVISQHDVLTGTKAWNYPMSTYYHDARTQVIYLNSELGVSNLLTGVSLYVSGVPGQQMNAWTIRMKHTVLTGYSNTEKQWETNDWVVMVQTNIIIASTGWIRFGFTTPFAYNGIDNLLVDFSFNNASWSSDGTCWSAGALTNRSLFYRTDSEYGDPLTWSGTTPSGTITNQVPVIRIEKSACVPITPLATGNFVNGAWSGNVTVLDSATNAHLYANDGAGHGGSSNPFDVLFQTIGLPEAVDNTTVPWTTGGSAKWYGQNIVSNDGVDAAKSGTIGNRQWSWMETQVVGPGNASFWWRVSSEADWDWLEFYVDGVLSDRISGETGWLRKTVALATGTHKLRWRYVKDGADIDPVGQDCGWVDMFSAPLQSVLPSSWLLQFGLATDGSADYIDSDNDGLSNWEEWMTGTVPTNRLSLLRIEALTSETGSGGVHIRWQSVPGKYYWVGSCESLTNPIFFTPFVSNVLGQAESTMVLDTRPVASGSRFYRVGTQ